MRKHVFRVGRQAVTVVDAASHDTRCRRPTAARSLFRPRRPGVDEETDTFLRLPRRTARTEALLAPAAQRERELQLIGIDLRDDIFGHSRNSLIVSMSQYS